MKIEISIEDHIIGYSFTGDDGKVLNYEELTRKDQIEILNSFAQGYDFFKRFLKEE